MPPKLRRRRSRVSSGAHTEEQTKHVSRFSLALTIIGSIASSVLIVTVNKRILADLPFPTFLTAFHQLAGWIFSASLERVGFFHVPKSRILSTSEGLKLGSAYVIGIVLMNASLTVNSVGTYQLLKLACIPAAAVLQYIINRRTLSYPTLLSLIILLSGVGLATVSDITLGALGLSVGALAVLVTSLSQVWLETRPSARGLDGLQILRSVSPYAFVVCVATAPWADRLGGSTKIRSMEDVVWLVGAIVVSCGLAIASNFTGFTLITQASAVTYQVIGHLKTVVVLTSVGNPKQHFGISVAIVGMILYSLSKMR
ncbi:hypothetical protein BJ742DRAFT_555915 [Cladochytrium replicatum]|nr:hypothetical protein BJ742DRAFT_555915 [Cladochytrium replicatum]